MSKTKIKMPARTNRKHRELEKAKKIAERPLMRRIGFDFPDKLLKDFKVAVNIRGSSMTKMIEQWMVEYCEDVKREKNLTGLSDE